MSNTIDYQQVNEAILEYQANPWTPTRDQQFAAAYPPEVVALVKQVYDEALGIPVDWYKQGMDDALAMLGDFLPKRFPWLSERAQGYLNHRFIMTWK